MNKGRNILLVRRANRVELRGFVYAAMRWLDFAPRRFWDWNDQPVKLKDYPDNPKGKNQVVSCEPRWFPPTKKIRRLVVESGCPIEVLAVAAWDVIKTLPLNAYESAFRRKRYYAAANERQINAKRAVAAGAKPSDRDLRAFDHYLAKNYGYVDADDLSLPFHSERASKTPEKIRRGDFDKTRAQRRKALGRGGRDRWSRPPDLFVMSSRMRSYWRKHASYIAACHTIAASCSAYSALSRGAQEAREAAHETQHGALVDSLLAHDGFASVD